MNKAILIGNITRDLELRMTASNKSVVEFSVAINNGYGDKKTTDYVNVVAWEKTAETLVNFCGKGSKVMVEGRIKTDSYDKNGTKVYKTYVLASNIEFLSREPEVKAAPKEDETTQNRNVVIEQEELPFY